jgi:hypothetical protein
MDSCVQLPPFAASTGPRLMMVHGALGGSPLFLAGTASRTADLLCRPRGAAAASATRRHAGRWPIDSDWRHVQR